jgi:hypothetical protein
MKLTYRKNPFEIEVKRFHVPGAKIEDDCPKCKEKVTVDLAREYISFPTANAVNKVHFYCGECDSEWDVKIHIEVTLTSEGR